MNGWAALLIATLASFSAQLFIKFGATSELFNKKIIALGLSILCYFLSFVMFYFANKKLPLSVVGPVGTIGVTILACVAGYLIFSEQIKLVQIIGVVLGAFAVLLIVIGSK